jgi:hypothetical protein
MKYIAKIGLRFQSKVIHAGSIVPDAYPAIEQALKKGWIEAIPDQSGPLLIESVSRETIEEPEAESIAEIPIESKQEEFENTPTFGALPPIETSDLDKEFLKEVLPFMADSLLESLSESGFKTPEDLRDASESELLEVQGIGINKVQKIKIAIKEYFEK